MSSNQRGPEREQANFEALLKIRHRFRLAFCRDCIANTLEQVHDGRRMWFGIEEFGAPLGSRHDLRLCLRHHPAERGGDRHRRKAKRPTFHHRTARSSYPATRMGTGAKMAQGAAIAPCLRQPLLDQPGHVAGATVRYGFNSLAMCSQMISTLRCSVSRAIARASVARSLMLRGRRLGIGNWTVIMPPVDGGFVGPRAGKLRKLPARP